MYQLHHYRYIKTSASIPQKMAEQDQQAGDTGPPKGIAAFKAHVIANKIDVAMWAVRLLTTVLVLSYIFPLFLR